MSNPEEGAPNAEQALAPSHHPRPTGGTIKGRISLRKRSKEKARREQFTLELGLLADALVRVDPNLREGGTSDGSSLRNRGELLEAAIRKLKSLHEENRTNKRRIEELERMTGRDPQAVPHTKNRLKSSSTGTGTFPNRSRGSRVVPGAPIGSDNDTTGSMMCEKLNSLVGQAYPLRLQMPTVPNNGQLARVHILVQKQPRGRLLSLHAIAQHQAWARLCHRQVRETFLTAISQDDCYSVRERLELEIVPSGASAAAATNATLFGGGVGGRPEETGSGAPRPSGGSPY